MELQSELTVSISHYLRDDQKDVKLWIFKYATLIVLKRSQPQPRNQFTVATRQPWDNKITANSILYVEKGNYCIFYF